ncbi:MAG: phosphatidate cytidylyltransferase, partial [Bacilli bacterium]|nr:phosphatidate cytidylyltransferase [Bacilli bacterium]
HVRAKAKRSLKSRIIYAVIMAIIAVPALILGGWFWFAFIGLLYILVGREIVMAVQKKPQWYVYVLVYGFLAAIVYWTIVRDNLSSFVDAKKAGIPWEFSLELHSRFLFVSPFLLISMIIIFFWVAVAQENFDFTEVCYLFTMIILCGLSLQSALYLRYVPLAFAAENGALGGLDSNAYAYWQSTELLVFIAIAAMINDIFAYLGGMLFGKHHMNERVSPKKTWEGFFIGWGFGAISAAAFGIICSVTGSPMLPGFLDADHWYTIIVAALILPVLGDLGDLSFSLIKRHFGFKDYSKVLGPHGGILDRLDSAFFCMIGFSMLVMICYYFRLFPGLTPVA